MFNRLLNSKSQVVFFVLLILSASIVFAGEKLPIKTNKIKGQQPAVEIIADVTGLDSIALIATGQPGGHAVWAEAVLIAEDGSQTRLVDLKPASYKVGWFKFTLNKAHDGKALEIAGRKFAHGIFAHADSKVIYKLSGKYKTFKAWAGINHTAAGHGEVVFEIQDGHADLIKDKIRKTTPAVIEEIRGILNQTNAKKQLRQLKHYERNIDKIRNDLISNASGVKARYEKFDEFARKVYLSQIKKPLLFGKNGNPLKM